MKLNHEPKGVDLIIKSTPWTDKELAELSAIIKKSQARKQRKLTETNVKTVNKAGKLSKAL